MEKDRNARIIAIIALVLAVAGVSIGFAVLSTNLTIEPIDASVKANNDLLQIYYSSSSADYETGKVVPVLNKEADGFTGNEINVDYHSKNLSGLGGTFTEPGQIITYNLGIANISKLDGYVFSFSGGKGNCEVVNDNNNPATSEELKRACDDLIFRIDIDDGQYTSTKFTTYANYLISKMTDGKPGMHKLKLEIEYKADAIPVTGDFKVTFSNAKFNYRTEMTPY